MPTNIRKIDWMVQYMDSYITKIRAISRVSTSCPRPSSMFSADYQRAIAVSIGRLTSQAVFFSPSFYCGSATEYQYLIEDMAKKITRRTSFRYHDPQVSEARSLHY